MTDYSQQYLTVQSQDDNNTITLTIGSAVTSSNMTSIYYSTNNGATWRTKNVDSTTQTINVSLNKGQTVLFKGVGTNLANNYEINGAQYRSTFSSTKNYIVYGNIMSMLYGDSFSDKTSVTGTYAFCGLFYQSTKLVDAKDLIIPIKTVDKLRTFVGTFRGCTNMLNTPQFAPEAITQQHGCMRMFQDCTSITSTNDLSKLTTITGASACMEMFRGCTSLVNVSGLPATTLADYCYYQMFRGCTSLAITPDLPSTNLAENCYYGMFWGCSSLAKAPELPATNLAANCYRLMFRDCILLTKSPVLLAATLVEGCYQNMFTSCSSLIEVICLATDISATNCISNWLSYVSASGTFYKASSMTSWPSGMNGIPSGWTTKDYMMLTVNGNIPAAVKFVQNGVAYDLSYLKFGNNLVWQKTT